MEEIEAGGDVEAGKDLKVGIKMKLRRRWQGSEGGRKADCKPEPTPGCIPGPTLPAR